MSSVARSRRRAGIPLFWRLFTTNAAVLVAAVAVLALSPATVSQPVSPGEAAVIIGGLFAMLVLNLVLMRRAFQPLERLSALMRRVDPLRPGERVPAYGDDAEVIELTRAFNEMLDRLETERRESARGALLAQEQERRRIAQELHDEVGQSLTAVLLHIEQAERASTGSDSEQLETAQEITRSSLAEVRTIARRLRPEALDELGLVSALASLSERAAESTGFELRRSLARDLPPLPPEVELVIYRVTQEALTNIARHADASTVAVSLGLHSDRIWLRVADDGSGLGSSEAGTGIQGMRERAVLVGGQLAVEPVAGGGVEVRLDLPSPTPAG